MRSGTVTTVLEASPDEVFSYLSNIQIDMFAGPSKQEMACFPTRVIAMPDGRSAYIFTMFQAPDMPDELFESQYESLKREFRNIEARLGTA